MTAIWKREFWHLFKGLRAIVLIAILVSCSIAFATWIRTYNEILFSDPALVEVPNIIYFRGLQFLILLFGFILIVAISHNTISEEIRSGRIRLYITKVSRDDVVIGKFLGIWTFWIVTITICYLLLVIFVRLFPLNYLLHMYSLITFSVGLTILLSTLFRNQVYTMIMGILLGITFPTIDILVRSIPAMSQSGLRFLTPPYWLEQPTPLYRFIPALIGLISVWLATTVMRRKDL